MQCRVGVPQPETAKHGFSKADLVVGDGGAPLNASGAGDAIFWTEAELYEWIDEAVKRFARKHAAFVVYDTSLAAATGTGDYTLPADHILTFQADLNGAMLRARNVQEIEALDSAWPTAKPEQPKAFLLDIEGLLKFTVYPAPSYTSNAHPSVLVCATPPPDVTRTAGNGRGRGGRAGAGDAHGDASSRQQGLRPQSQGKKERSPNPAFHRSSLHEHLGRRSEPEG